MSNNKTHDGEVGLIWGFYYNNYFLMIYVVRTNRRKSEKESLLISLAAFNIMKPQFNYPTVSQKECLSLFQIIDVSC